MITPNVNGRGLPLGTADAVRARLFPTPDPLAKDPVLWAKERAGVWLWSKQREIIESVRDNRYTAVQSCHGAGKSFTASVVLAHWLDTHPVNEVFVVWTAPRWPQVQAIIGRELRSLHKRINLPGRITLDCQCYMGDDVLVGYGRKPADTDEHGFQGIHAKYVLIVIDEACGVPKQLWNAIESLMTNEHCRVLAIGNPDDPSAEFAEVCKPGSDYNVIKIPADSTPNFTDEWVPDKVRPLLVSPLWVAERKKRWGEDSMLWMSKVMAEFPDVSHDTLFPPRLLLKMANLDLPGLGKGRYGLDVARFGPDRNTLYRNRDGVIRLVDEWSKASTIETAERVRAHLGARGVPINVDVNGVGGGVFDQLAKWGMEVSEFNSSHQPQDTSRFVNRRAEIYWTMREDADLGLVDIDPDDLDLQADLGKLKYKIVNGKIQIESKDDIKKRLKGASPDYADGAMISYADGAGFTEEALRGQSAAEGDGRETLTHDLLTRSM